MSGVLTGSFPETATAATCSLPSQQQLGNAQNIMHGEKVVEFPIKPYPALGTVTTEVFIRAKEIWVNPGAGVNVEPVPPYNIPNLDVNGHPTLTARYDGAVDMPGIFLQGDGRGSDLNFSPEKTRAFAVLDFAAGRGYIVVNKSVSKLRFGVGPLSYTIHKSWDARPTYFQWGNANNWVYGDWINGSDYRLRFHIKESAFGTSWVAPAIDTQIVINKDTARASVTGDSFPTVAVHQPTACRTLTVRNEVNPGDLYQNESPGSINPGNPVNAAPGSSNPGSPAPTPPPAPVNKTPIASFTYTRQAGAGNKVYLNGGGSYDPDGSISSWRWNRGGTVIANGRTATVSMGDVTSANVTLTVTDNKGATGSTTRTLSLPNRIPTITSSNPANGSTVGSNTPTLSVTGKDDDADPLQYHYHLTGPYVDISSGWIGASWQVPAHRLDPGTNYTWSVAVRDTKNAQSSRTSNFTVAMLPTANELVSLSTGNGYWQVAGDGGVFSYGAAQFYGSLPGVGVRVNNIIGMARTPTDKGYWLVGKDGGVFAFGDAGFYGSLPGLNVKVGNIVGMAPTKNGQGYWLVGGDGGVFAFGNAGFHGSMGGKPLNKPVQAIAPTATSGGYWLAAEDGGVFAFGDAPFYGSMGGQLLNYPIVDIDTTPDGKGYWLAAQDGGIFAFGNAPFHGSMAGKPLNGHITSMSTTPNGGGYWLNGCDGGIFAFGNAPFYGSQPRYGCRGIWY